MRRLHRWHKLVIVYAVVSATAAAWTLGTYTPNSSINNVDFSCYMNNFPSWALFEHKYAQVILSKQTIACPTS